MPVKFGTVDFYQAMADMLNNDPEWATIGKKLSYSMVYDYGPPVDKRFYVVFDEGRVTEVREAVEGDADAANFVVSGPADIWRGVFEKTVNPTAALTRGQMKVKGKMTVLLKNMDAFSYVIDTMTKVDFE
ncbi:MAG: SCP2 sterol-binding domain-containing protein [Acidimicrobiia bacterium]